MERADFSTTAGHVKHLWIVTTRHFGLIVEFLVNFLKIHQLRLGLVGRNFLVLAKSIVAAVRRSNFDFHKHQQMAQLRK